MAAAATVAVAIRWAPSQGRRLFSSSSRSDVQQCGWPKATFVHPVAVFSGPQQWKAGHKIHKMFNGEQQNDGNDNGRVVRKPPRRSRNANGDVPESDIVRKRARQNSTSNSSGATRGTTSSQSGGGGNDWPAFGGGNNNNNSRRTGTSALDLDMLLMPQMVSSDSSRGSTSAAAVVQQVPQGSNATSAAAAVMPMSFLDNNNINLPVAFSSGSDGSGGGGGALTVAGHMPWGLSTTGGGSGEGGSVQHLQNLVYMAGVPQSAGQAQAVTMTTAAAATWTANSGTFVSGGCGGTVVAGGMFGRASCGGSAGGASGFGGMQALPPHIRDAIERVHARQMQKMTTVQPDFADILPPCADNGMSSLGWLMLDWQADMVMGRVVGIVVLCGPFTTVSGLNGFDVRLMFDHNNAQQEMAVHCWEECMPRLANNIQCGAVVEFCRLKVREQGKNNKGSFPFTLLYNNESRHRILSASSNISANLMSSSNTPIIVEAVEQQQHLAGSSITASSRPSSATGTTAIASSSHHSSMSITAAQQNTRGGGGSQDVRVAKNGNGNATDVHEQQSEDDGPNATAANLNSVGAQRVVDAEPEHDDDEEGTSETAWLSTARPPPPSCTPVGRPFCHRRRRRRLLHSISPPAGPSHGRRSSPPPQRACSISAQRNLHTVVQRINDLEAQVARDERNARERRQRARRQQLLLQQHQHMPLSSSSSPSPSPHHVANAAEADVITIDDVEPLGLAQQQQLHRGDARYFAHELMTLEDEAGAAEMIILDNEPLSVADREWLISTAFKMRQLPSSVKGSVEVDENGNSNISCCICRDWIVSDADSVVRLACQHFLHRKCFAQEAMRRSICPLCRRHFVTGETMPTNEDGGN